MMPAKLMIRVLPLLILLAVSSVLAFGRSPAEAQEVYRLDDGQWQAQPTPDPASPEGQLQLVRKRLAEGKAKQAQQLANRWLDQHRNHPLQVEARLLRGDAKVAMGDYYDALFDYEFIARSYTASEQWLTALEREYEIARLFVEGMPRKFLGMRILPADGEGEELLIRIQERVPGSELGEKASILLADYYFDEGDMFLASEAYDLFLLNYPDSPQREWAMLRLVQANLARFKGPSFDPTGLIEAMQRLQAYQREFPAAAQRIGAEALMVRIRASLAEKELIDAGWYEQRGEVVSAAYLYQRIVESHPETPAAKTAMARLARLPVPVVEKVAAIPTVPGPARSTFLPTERSPRDLRQLREQRQDRDTPAGNLPAGRSDPHRTGPSPDEPAPPVME